MVSGRKWGEKRLTFPLFHFLALVPFFCVVKTENQSFSAPKQQGTRLLRSLVVPISSMNPWITAGAWSLMSLESVACTLKERPWLSTVHFILLSLFFCWVTVDLEHAWGAIAETARTTRADIQCTIWGQLIKDTKIVIASHAHTITIPH